MPDSGVFSLPIAIRFNVFKDAGSGHAPSNVSFSVNEFDFQCVKEALHCRIVITDPAPVLRTSDLFDTF